MDGPHVQKHSHHDSKSGRSGPVPNTHIVGSVNVRRWLLRDARMF